MKKTYLNIGCGDKKIPGFINIDTLPSADLRLDVTKGLPFENNSVDVIFNEHFIEHLSQGQGVKFFRDCRRVLKPGGRIRIATPDLDFEVERYQNKENWQNMHELPKFGINYVQNRCELFNIAMRNWGHQWLYNEEELIRLAEEAGLQFDSRCAFGVSADPLLSNLEYRTGSRLIVEFIKPIRTYSQDEPFISILIPAYNKEYIAATLESAVSQTYKNIEIVISDDSETQDIEKIVKTFSKKDARIRYYKNEKNLGEAGRANYLKVFSLAKGEFIKFLNDDDVLAIDCVAKMADALKQFPDVTLVTSYRKRINAHGEFLADEDYNQKIAEEDTLIDGASAIGKLLGERMNYIGEPTTVMFRKADIEKTRPDIFSFGGRTALRNGDVTMWVNLLSKGDLIYFTEPLSFFRIHSKQQQHSPEYTEKVIAAWQQILADAERMGLSIENTGSLREEKNSARSKSASQRVNVKQNDEYAAKLKQEISIYEQNTNVHNLPEIHDVYTGKFLVPSLQQLSGRGDWKEWWIKEIDEFVEKVKRPVTILSLACGNGDLEIDLLNKLSTQDRVTIIGVDVNPKMIARAREMAKKQNLSQAKFEVQDLNFPNLSAPIDIVLANQSLHHLVKLENLFDEIAAKASPDMIFLINDMIGRNGHIMWPNSELVMQKLWQELPKKYKRNAYTKKYDSKPFNYDCSNDGFEGIRAQDILPLLVRYFDVEMFLPFSTIINRFTERVYGHNFDTKLEQDKQLILSILKLDVQLMEEKKLAPTQAFMRVQQKGTVNKMRYLYQTPQEAIAARQFAVPSDEKAFSLETPARRSKRIKPLVSIVIPVFNNLEYTKKCLTAIETNTTYPNYEIIIIDNASSDGTTEFLKNQMNSGIRAVFNTANKGFVDACNQGADISRGVYILLLNNDTEVQPGWLCTLVQFAEENEDCGAIGSKLVYPDKTLQEAGGIIFSDGNGWNFGRGHKPDDLRFSFVREVDYCSGAALMVKNELWKKAGGLDSQYAPAYYEDTDMCFTVRKLGYKVYYHPHSVVIHYEGKTAGTDLTTGFKKYQKINRSKFIKKWKNELKLQQCNNPINLVNASNRQATKNIIVFDPFLPMFDKASGSLRLFHILKLLKKIGFHVTFIARNGSNEKKYKPILEKLGIMTVATDIEAMRHAGVALKDIPGNIDYKSFLQERFYDYAIIDFWDMAEFYVPIIRQFSPKTKIIIDSVDIHFIRELREAELRKDKILRQKALQNKKKELAVYQKADRIWVVTEEDRQALKGLVKKIPIDIVPNIHKKVDFEKNSRTVPIYSLWAISIIRPIRMPFIFLFAK